MRLGSLLIAASLSWAAPALSSPFPPYAVIFEVNLRPDGQVENLKLDRVVDARSGSPNAVNIRVPPEYIEAVRAKLNARTEPVTQTHYFTYFIFDPNDPKNPDIGTSK